MWCWESRYCGGTRKGCGYFRNQGTDTLPKSPQSRNPVCPVFTPLQNRQEKAWPRHHVPRRTTTDTRTSPFFFSMMVKTSKVIEDMMKGLDLSWNGDRKLVCPLCHKKVRRDYLKRHQQRQICKKIAKRRVKVRVR